MSENSCDQSRHDFGAFSRFLNFLLRLLRMCKSPSAKVKAVTADSGINLHGLITIECASSKQHRSKRRKEDFCLQVLVDSFQLSVKKKKKKSAEEWWQKSQVVENSLHTNVE